MVQSLIKGMYSETLDFLCQKNKTKQIKTKQNKKQKNKKTKTKTKQQNKKQKNKKKLTLKVADVDIGNQTSLFIP